MENILTPVLKLAGSRSPDSKDVFGIPVILRHILQQFSTRELLQLSLVNKRWNFEARSVLRDRGTLTARIHSRSRGYSTPCEKLSDFVSDLRLMRVVPFSGIQIALMECDCNSSSKGPANPLYNAALNRLPWKHLTVQVHEGYENSKDCPIILLVKKILEDFCGALESLDLKWEETEFFRNIFQHHRFPRLRTLKVYDGSDGSDGSTEFLKLLISRAPNLQELHAHVLGDYEQDNVLEGSSAVLVPQLFFNPLYERAHDGLISALRPRTIDVHRGRPQNEFDAGLLHTYIPMVFEASRTTLTTLRMDLLFAVPLMCYGICLENVTTLEILMDHNDVDGIPDSFLALLKSFDSARVLPKLSKVEIVNNDHDSHISWDEISGFFEQASSLLRNALPDRAINIERLELKRSYRAWDSCLPTLGQMFPDVKILSVTFDEEPGFPFTPLWEYFGKLEKLNVTNAQWNVPMIANLDSVFCGIFPEEAAELQEHDEEYLKAVQIVPVMPSITCMKDLRTLTLRCEALPDLYPENDPTLMFSKVTGLIGFARCPALAVTFLSTHEMFIGVMSHMKPYASLVADEDRYRSDS